MTLITGHQQLAEALRFYGMGEPADGVERTSVAAVIERVTETEAICDVMNLSVPPAVAGGVPKKRCLFLRSQVIVLHYNLQAAIVRIPRAFLPAFCLWKYELTGKLLEGFERRVATNLALPHRQPAKVEKFGSVRI